MDSVQKKPLLTYLSIARIFAIYWVVLVQHNFAPFHKSWNWIGNGEFFFNPISEVSQYITKITMPLCFFISGFILEYCKKIEKQSFREFGLEKLKRLLIPCYVFSVFFCFLQTECLSYNILLGYKHLWFIFYLFIYFVLSFFLLKWKNFVWKVCLLCITIFSLYLSSNLLHSGFLWSITYYYIWFLLGFISSTWSNKINNKIVIFLLLVGCCYVVCSIYGGGMSIGMFIHFLRFHFFYVFLECYPK